MAVIWDIILAGRFLSLFKVAGVSKYRGGVHGHKCLLKSFELEFPRGGGGESKGYIHGSLHSELSTQRAGDDKREEIAGDSYWWAVRKPQRHPELWHLQ